MRSRVDRVLRPGRNAKEIKVGFFCPLSGAVAVYGNESLAAARFALDEIARSKLLGLRHDNPYSR